MKTSTMIGLVAAGLAGYAIMKPGQVTEQLGGAGGGFPGFSLGDFKFPDFNLDLDLGGLGTAGMPRSLDEMLGILSLENRLTDLTGTVKGLTDTVTKGITGGTGPTDWLTAYLMGQLGGVGDKATGDFEKWWNNFFGGGEKDTDIVDPEYKVDTGEGWGPDPWGQWVNYITGWQNQDILPTRTLALVDEPVAGELYNRSGRPFLFPWETPKGEGFVMSWEGVLPWDKEDVRPRTWRDVYDAAVERGAADPIDWGDDNEDRAGVDIPLLTGDFEESHGPSPERPVMSEDQLTGFFQTKLNAFVGVNNIALQNKLLHDPDWKPSMPPVNKTLTPEKPGQSDYEKKQFELQYGVW